jgi:hypothetical protein
LGPVSWWESVPRQESARGTFSTIREIAGKE